MKKLLLIAVLAVAAVSVNAFTLFSTYIGGGTNTISVGGTNAVIANVYAAQTKPFNLSSVVPSTNAFPAVEFVPGSGVGARYMPVQISCAGDANSGANITVRLASSVDRFNWKTNSQTILVALSNTAQVTTITVIDTQSVPYWCITGIDNTNASVNVTNLYVNASVNPGL